MRVGFITWITALARPIPLLLMLLAMPGLALAQGNPGAPQSAPGIGPQDCYWRGKTADVIVSACTAQLEKDPADGDALVKRGPALSELGDFSRAHADLDAAVAIYTKADDYKLGNAYAARGALFLAQRDLPNAIADFTRAIERQPDEPLRYADRARALLASGDAKAALPDAERARSDSYGFAYPLLLRARIYLALGRRDDAVDDLRRAARLDPHLRTMASPRRSVRGWSQALTGTTRKGRRNASWSGSVWPGPAFRAATPRCPQSLTPPGFSHQASSVRSPKRGIMSNPTAMSPRVRTRKTSPAWRRRFVCRR